MEVEYHIWKGMLNYQTLNLRQSLQVLKDDSSKKVRSKGMESVFRCETMCWAKER